MTRNVLLPAALLPAVDPTQPDVCLAVLEQHGDALRSLIWSQGLAPLWHARTGAAEFRAAHRWAAVRYLMQRRALSELDELFRAAGIPYVTLKGAAVRELVYEDPTTRPSADIDILVRRSDRRAAARTLVAAGYSLWVVDENVSHEVSLMAGEVHIDLHSDLLRPGRLRGDAVTGLLARSRRHAAIQVPADDDVMFLMLAHPAFTEHVIDPTRGGARIADLMFWLQNRSVDWESVEGRARDHGVRTATWATLYWATRMMPDSFDMKKRAVEAVRMMSPGPARRRYLRIWLDWELPLHLPAIHHARLAAFSALLHDRPRDVLRALTFAGIARLRRHSDAMEFAGIAPASEAG